MSDEQELQLCGRFNWQGAIISSDLEHVTRHVLITLALHMSTVGDSCFPSITQLSLECNRSRTTIVKHLKIAVEAGWLKKEQIGMAGQKWKRNQYFAFIPESFWLSLNARLAEGGTAGVPRPLMDAFNTWKATKQGGTAPVPAHQKGGTAPVPPYPEGGTAGSEGGTAGGPKVVQRLVSNNSYNKTNNKNMGDTKKSLVIFCDRCKIEPYSIKIDSLPLCVHCAARALKDDKQVDSQVVSV